ncbi:hypothetical protein L211DRAFT_853869 [Terfezia boudieri ATCC MYA-4762]|uniref:Uncharacterized protein n=1 Tax=Terfezia boudieri ATCC MYA-4762 TaxID=1051890 RepID=A0A3N4LB59_9PEZI|nr:hypothetical protein L211DRAFT_853869 [Terfezia boudieri ATCC MYA-4762]
MFPELTDPSKLDKAGAESSDWKQSKPVRVIRSDKMRHSKYAQQKVMDTTGIYNLFRRDDPAPAQWTKEGEAGFEDLGPSPTGYEPEKTIAALAITMFPELADPSKQDEV